MRLGLRMGLNSRQGGGGDLPSLDLAFALDRSFTTDPAAAGNALITSRRGPTAKFSRGSGATQVNAAGLIEYAPENLLTRSEEFDNTAGWAQTLAFATANQTISPSGNNDADLVTARNSLFGGILRRSVTPAYAVNTTYAMSVYAKAGTHQFIGFRITDESRPTGSEVYPFFTLSGAGSASFTAPRGGSILSASCTAVGAGWYRCVLVYTTAASSTGPTTDIAITLANGSTNFTPSGTETVYLWGAQVERASTARTYYPTTSAAFYGPRFDYDPATGASKGLLIEEPRTNFLPNSGQANLWPVQNATITDVGRSIAPDASLNGFVVVLGLANLNPSGGSLGAGAYTHSVFMKRVDSDWVRIQFNHANNTNIGNAYFNLATGQVGAVSVGAGSLTGLSADMKSYPNGWWRLQVTATVPTTGVEQLSIISADSNSGARLAGATYEIWGGQIEAGAFPLSYIPTTSGTAARSADVGSIAGDDFSLFYNQSEGTILARADKTMSSSAVGSYLSFFAGATEVGPLITRTSSQLLARIRNSAGSDIANADFTETPNGLKSVAAAWKANSITSDRAVVTNGVLVTLTNLQAVDAASNQSSLNIGSRATGVSIFNGHIARIQYFRKRLSNAKLQTLTAP